MKYSDLETGKKIGFILDSIDNKSSLNDLLKVATKSNSNDLFFLFPGGKLEKENSADHSRNTIYSLVNPKNVDGFVSWVSSIRADSTNEELMAFHEKLSALPFITLGYKIEDHACVKFDAYSGMKDLVRHFVKCHNSKKFLFIKGSENSSLSESCLKAFLDELKECGLKDSLDEKLISNHVNIDNVQETFKELFEDRKLIPDEDFDTIITCSDAVALEVIEYLSEKGIKVPQNVLLGGFRNTIESRCLNPQFTTVQMPQKEFAVEVLNMMNQVFSDKQVEDKYIAPNLVVRESCGCDNIINWEDATNFRSEIDSKERFRFEFRKAFRLETRSESVRNRIDMLFDALFDNSKTEYLSLLESILEDYLKSDGELANIFAALNVLKKSSFLPEDYSEKLIKTVSAMIPQIMDRVAALKNFNNNKVNSILKLLKNEMLSITTRIELLNTLKKHLPKLGVHTLSIVLYDSTDISKYFGGFNLIPGISEFRTDEVLFSSESLIPDEYNSDFKRGIYIVQPLFVENKSYGYLIINYSGCDGAVYEDIRISVSNVLQKIFLAEEIEASKITVEQAEYEKTEFFATVGSDLCDPLKDLSIKISQIERNVNDGILDVDIIGEQLIFLKSQVEAQLEKTETLVDLTRSQVDDLPLDKKLFSLNQILPANVVAGFKEDMPLLFGDVEYLKKAMLNIFNSTIEIPEIKVEVDGLHIKFNSPKLNWQKSELRLTEKIILLQYGDILKTEDSAEIIFPWPNLSALPPARFDVTIADVMSLSDSEFNLFGKNLHSVFNREFDFEKITTGTTFVWKADEASTDELVKVYGLRRNDKFFRCPIICYSSNLIGHNFIEVLEQKVKSQKTSSVLFIGTKKAYGTWATEENSVSIPSMDSFDNILNEITPSIIVFEHAEENDIIKIRKNHKTAAVPVLVIPEEILSDSEIEMLCKYPKIILCNQGAAEAEQFNERINDILTGDEILPAHTGAIVKKAILYLNKNAPKQVVRWELAEYVQVSEDYLTRVFHKEIGLSLWEYLNRYRIHLAKKLLLETNDSIFEVSEKSGFQDQAYFCRVFKKICGFPPGKMRSKN